MMEQDPLSAQVVACAFRAHALLGPGFAEKVYEKALAHELRRAGIPAQSPHGCRFGEGQEDSAADLIVAGRLPVEIKAVKSLEGPPHAQGSGSARSGGFEARLLFNFGAPKLEIRRMVAPCEGS